jgi:hypothetical protein
MTSPTNLPTQIKGKQSNNCHSSDQLSIAEARAMFRISRTRLLDVNNWEKVCEGPSARFSLMNKDGEKVEGPTEKGLFIKIDIPAPGSHAGKGFDYVVIESLESFENDELDEELFSMRVRPAPRPGSNEQETAHFFTSAATSNFIIHRMGVVVWACVIGRNEEANNEVDNLFDIARNKLIAGAAELGLSDVQWSALAKGLVKEEIQKIY